MKIKNKPALFIIIVLFCGGGVFIMKTACTKSSNVAMKEIKPFTGDIRLTVSTTGTVLPKNRLELKPSVAGRIEEIRVKEGDTVYKGRILALMSSTDRAALIDAARLQGAASLAYWQDAYKPIPIISPINGTVIVRSIEPGQTVTTADAILVISDRLIVKAQVDETDIGKVVEGQSAYISLDSHPEVPVKGKVTHIYYESETVNNVTIYNVVITPDRVPAEFRSGMSASIDITEKERKNALLIPRDVIIQEGNLSYVLVKNSGSKEPEKRPITTGITDDQNIEVTEGLSTADTVMVPVRSYTPEKASDATNPFMPKRPGATKK